MRRLRKHPGEIAGRALHRLLLHRGRDVEGDGGQSDVQRDEGVGVGGPPRFKKGVEHEGVGDCGGELVGLGADGDGIGDGLRLFRREGREKKNSRQVEKRVHLGNGVGTQRRELRGDELALGEGELAVRRGKRRDLVNGADVIEAPEKEGNLVDEEGSEKESVVGAFVEHAPQAIHAVAVVIEQPQHQSVLDLAFEKGEQPLIVRLRERREGDIRGDEAGRGGWKSRSFCRRSSSSQSKKTRRNGRRVPAAV